MMHVGDLEEIRDLKAELRRQHAEIEQLKAERDAAVFALEHQRHFFDRYCTPAKPITSGSGTATYTGCLACGIGKNGTAYGYVCPRQDCPIRISYGVTHE
jgi:hypothetical protein